MDWLSKCVCGSRAPDTENLCKNNRGKKKKESKKRTSDERHLQQDYIETNPPNGKLVALLKERQTNTSDEKLENICDPKLNNDDEAMNKNEKITERVSGRRFNCDKEGTSCIVNGEEGIRIGSPSKDRSDSTEDIGENERLFGEDDNSRRASINSATFSFSRGKTKFFHNKDSCSFVIPIEVDLYNRTKSGKKSISNSQIPEPSTKSRERKDSEEEIQLPSIKQYFRSTIQFFM